jgi:hypothetical protein
VEGKLLVPGDGDAVVISEHGEVVGRVGMCGG